MIRGLSISLFNSLISPQNQWQVEVAVAPFHVHGRRALGGRVVAKLTIRVSAPTLGHTAAGDGAGVIPTRCNRGHAAGQSAHVHGRRALGGRVVAKLTKEVVAPALDPVAAGLGPALIKVIEKVGKKALDDLRADLKDGPYERLFATMKFTGLDANAWQTLAAAASKWFIPALPAFQFIRMGPQKIQDQWMSKGMKTL